ncbi:E3 ubiquitin-protein ligase rnf213-alpha-like isoform X2 [Ptychodera flava]|uniref:E3 ubiquitin-protein ligase rnf213-alpha-like isoform X2 n=1 Tax=Ptychodera flava TaxID=63121 RepID=UPI00396A2D61
MLEDEEDQTQRSTQRIEILLELFKHTDAEPNATTFVSVLKERICELLKEKDERAGDMAATWLSREAVTGERVQVHGTFRRAIWQSLVGTVTPLLAEVIAFCDRNDNLDLIINSHADSWVHRLWLDILRNPNLSELRYESFLSPVKNTPRDTVPVTPTGVNNSHFSCHCPFSNVIRNYVDETMENALSMKASSRQPVHILLRTLLNESELTRTLLSKLNRKEMDEFMRCYVYDFVRMVYKARDDTEYQVICGAIETAALEQHISEGYDPGKFALDIPSVHTSYHRIHGRLDSFSQIAKLLPKGISDAILNQSQMVLDAYALRALLENLEPQKDQLNEIDNRVQWLKSVQDARPVVERILEAEKQDSEGEVYGDISKTTIQACRPLWVRICVLKLFVDHVCPASSKVGEDVIKKVHILNKALGEQVNLQKIKSMKVIENVLKICNETASRQHFKYGVHECEVCQEAIKEPVALPCEHVFCLNCIKEWFRVRQRTCPKCTTPVDKKFEVISSKKSKEAVAAHNAFRQRCNAFFMEVVSRYCFAEGQAPEPELVTMLMGYVTRHREEKGHQTRGFTPFQEDCIDPNPVVRSFLLQLLLKSSVEQVYQHLQTYLDEARAFMKTDAEVLELCLLCIQCIEDSYHNSAIQCEFDVRLATMRSACRRLNPTIHEYGQEQAGVDVAQLESVAGARFGLVVAAEQIHAFYGGSDQHNEKQQKGDAEAFKEARRLLDIAMRFCENTKSKWPKVFLVKQIARRYGTDCLQSIVKHLHLKWIMPPEGNVEVTFVPDRFVTCGNTYQELREAMAETLISADFKKVDKILRNRCKSNEEKQSLLLLAIYREITMCHANKYADGAQQTPVDAQVTQNLVTYVKSAHFVTAGDFAEDLIFNRQGGKCGSLNVTPDQRPHTHTVSALVIHAMIVLKCCSHYNAILPYVTLFENPQNMANSFFPTMHEDLILEAKAAISESVQWYECPNGHPYTIGECGRPYGLGQCKDCGAAIGGQSHTPAAGNKLARMHDTTQTGHILGAPDRRHNEIPVPERQMPPVATAIVRLLMHAAMIGAATKAPRNLTGVIHPTINNNAVPQFLLHHLDCDLQLLSRASGKSIDDSALIVHMVLNRMLTTKPQGHDQFNPLLISKKCRLQWEDTFTRTFINPIVQDVTTRLQQANRLVHDDKRLGNNPLLKLLHEVDPPSQNLSTESLYNVPTVWRYRSRVTIEHLTHALQESMAAKKHRKQCRILKEFLDREHVLRALKYLPDIIHLQQLLIDRFHRNIDVHEATNLKIGRFLSELPKGHIRNKHYRLLESFATAWNLVRQDVADYGGLFVPKDLSDQVIDGDSSLAMILPTRKGDGVCSTALVDFLIITQNQFMDKYKAITNRDVSDVLIKPCDLTPADLIAYDPEKDLLPMVLSHCNYSLEVGRGTLVEYDLPSLERQLEERFIRGKAKILRKIEQLVFRQDSRDAAVFESLKSKIPQEPLSKAIQHQILSELRSLPEVSDSLACLDIAIGFLASSGGKPDMHVIKYLVSILKMERSEMKVRYPCQLKHILALWQLLAVERARRLTINAQDPFDSLNDYREELNPELVQNLCTALRSINVDSLVNELHHYIAIGLKKQKDAEEDVPNWKLRDVLMVYIDYNDHDEIANLEEIPEDILVKHIWSTWTVVINYQQREAHRY